MLTGLKCPNGQLQSLHTADRKDDQRMAGLQLYCTALVAVQSKAKSKMQRQTLQALLLPLDVVLLIKA